MRSKSHIGRRGRITLGGILTCIVLIIVFKMRSLFPRRTKGFLLISVVVILIFVVSLMNLLSPDGFSDFIQSLSPDYFNTIGAPARTWPKYREEQRYNVEVLGNVGNGSSNEKEVKIGPYGLRLNSLVKSSN